MLLAMVSHDLRQPLQIIMAAHDALEVRLIGEPERRHLERIERAVTQVADRLELLLQALRLRESTGKTELEPVWLNVALEELTGELGDRARQKGIELRISATGAGVWSQSVLLGGVLRNLMRNAIDYTPAGGRVLVGCRRRGPKVRIEVHDSGAGISDEQQAVVFQAFQRGTTTQPGGLGLGLFIVKRAADFLGHHIELRSAAGHGSCFTVIADALAPSGDRRVSPL
jgi:signal transduction histidine kinase